MNIRFQQQKKKKFTDRGFSVQNTTPINIYVYCRTFNSGLLPKRGWGTASLGTTSDNLGCDAIQTHRRRGLRQTYHIYALSTSLGTISKSDAIATGIAGLTCKSYCCVEPLVIHFERGFPVYLSQRRSVTAHLSSLLLPRRHIYEHLGSVLASVFD